MDELLKDAIADAKAVRETALANAKLALEEAFTPRLKSMLSKKIQSEMEDAVDELEIDDMDGEDGEEEEANDEMAGKSSYMGRDGEEMDDEDGEEAPEADMEADMEEDMGDEDGEEEMEDEGVIEINGVKYAPVMEAEEDEEAEEVDEMKDEDDDEMDEDLDLDEILKELEEVDEADEVDEEVDQSSGIGSGDNKKGDVDKSSGIGTAGKAKMTEAEDEDEAEEVDESEKVEETDEDVDLEEVIKALSEDEVTESTEEVVTLKGDLKEHRKVVRYLREKLNEVNLLNAKLLFTNKLFRAFGMTNEQKMKVVETFDRAKTLREIKLVYTTVAENFGNENIKPIKETRTKGSASKAVASTKSTKQEIISESDDMKQRFQKLANIL
jgi:hypothetical protein